MSKNAKMKMTRDVVPEDFTMSLALVDALPVLFFCASAIVAGRLFQSGLFMLGAALCFLGGAGKVLWKIIVVRKKKNVWPLFVQMRILMPAGFAMMLLSVILGRSRIHFGVCWKAVCSFPSCLFFLIGIAGMALMVVFALKLDSSDKKSNWIEQLTNGIAQAAFFAGLLFLL